MGKVGRPRKKVKEICPFYRRNNDRPKDYKCIECKACSFVIGFSGYFDRYWLSPKTYNAFTVNTYNGNSFEHARDSYVKNKCKGDFKECKYYKRKMGIKE